MTHPSILTLHRLRLGELAPTDEGALRRHLADCPGCAARLDQQHDARAAFLREPSPPWLAPAPSAPARLLERLLERLPAWLRQRSPLTLLPGALLSGALPILAIAALSGPLLPADQPPDLPAPHARPKGIAPLLEAWIETGQSPRPLYEGEALRAGDRVQLRFDPGARRFVTLAGRDSDGTVEIYGVIPAKGPGVQSAPFALTLDGTRGPQTFFAVLTDTRPDSGAIQAQLSGEEPSLDQADILALTVEKTVEKTDGKTVAAPGDRE